MSIQGNSSSRWESDSIASDATDRDLISSRSSRTLMRASSTIGRRTIMTPKNKLALTTFSIVCLIGIVIGTGYIYLQHNFGQDVIDRKDVVISRDDDDDDDRPVAEARRAVFILPDSPITPPPGTVHHNRTVFDPNITTRALPADAQSKNPVSLLFETVVRPPLVFTSVECPDHRTGKFYKTNLTIGSGQGVLGYGKNIRDARRIAAEDAITTLFPNITYPAPDCAALAQRCGG